MSYWICLFLSYFMGSLPFGVWVAKAYGIDIFSVGSNNPGATNISRIFGRKLGIFVFFCDFSKGLLAVALPLSLKMPEWITVSCALGSILGHNYSFWIKFRGGKGVATTIGSLMLLLPGVLGIGLILWLIVFYRFRYVSLASIIFALSLPISAYFLNCSALNFCLCCALTISSLWRHRSNLRRLFRKKELRS